MEQPPSHNRTPVMESLQRSSTNPFRRSCPPAATSAPPVAPQLLHGGARPSPMVETTVFGPEHAPHPHPHPTLHPYPHSIIRSSPDGTPRPKTNKKVRVQSPPPSPGSSLDHGPADMTLVSTVSTMSAVNMANPVDTVNMAGMAAPAGRRGRQTEPWPAMAESDLEQAWRLGSEEDSLCYVGPSQMGEIDDMRKGRAEFVTDERRATGSVLNPFSRGPADIKLGSNMEGEEEQRSDENKPVDMAAFGRLLMTGLASAEPVEPTVPLAPSSMRPPPPPRISTSPPRRNETTGQPESRPVSREASANGDGPHEKATPLPDDDPSLKRSKLPPPPPPPPPGRYSSRSLRLEARAEDSTGRIAAPASPLFTPSSPAQVKPPPPLPRKGTRLDSSRTAASADEEVAPSRSSTESTRSRSDSARSLQQAPPAPPPPRRQNTFRRSAAAAAATPITPISPAAMAQFQDPSPASPAPSEPGRSPPPPPPPPPPPAPHSPAPSFESIRSAASLPPPLSPLPPPTATPSRGSSARSKENAPPAPPPPRQRGGSRGNSYKSGGADGAAAAMAAAAGAAGTVPVSAKSSKGVDILADLAALQKEVDALRGAYEGNGGGEGASKE